MLEQSARSVTEEEDGNDDQKVACAYSLLVSRDKCMYWPRQLVLEIGLAKLVVCFESLGIRSRVSRIFS